MTSYYSKEELVSIGFRKLGDENVLISRNTKIYGAENISIENNVRIDDFCILSGNIKIGNYVHIAAATLLFAGNAGIELCDFSNLSSRCAIYAISDDFSGLALTNPMIPGEYRNVIQKEVVLKKHVLIGSGCTILPGVTIGEGSAVGSMSLVRASLEEWGIYAGIPCNKIGTRDKKILSLEKRFYNKE